MNYWPVVVLFLAGDGLRSLGGKWGGVSPGLLGGAFPSVLPSWLALPLFAVYGSFALLPFAILMFSDRSSAKAAGLVVLADGLLHLVLPVKPPWMVGASTRWAAQQHYFKFALDKDSNPMAAFPSLHVALPASQRWWSLAAAIAAAVVLLGEHWVIDAAAGWALAIACRRAVARYWPETATEPAPVASSEPEPLQRAA